MLPKGIQMTTEYNQRLKMIEILSTDVSTAQIRIHLIFYLSSVLHSYMSMSLEKSHLMKRKCHC